jgi:hypothetical protein
MTTKFTKGSFVTYDTTSGKVRAIVRRIHRDGDCTVEARHYLDDVGKEIGAYLGFKFRVDPTTLQASS